MAGLSKREKRIFSAGCRKGARCAKRKTTRRSGYRGYSC